MNIFAYFKKSIGLMQAALLLMASLSIGIAISGWEMQSVLAEQRQAAVERIDQLMDLVTGGAANAAWAFDPRLAREVVSGIINQPGVRTIEIRASLRNGNEERLVRRENPRPESGDLVAWISQIYFSDIVSKTQNLSVENQGKPEQVGKITISLIPEYAADKFISRAYSVLSVGLLHILLAGLVLLLLAQWLVTSPLKRAAAKIAQISPESLDGTNYSIEIPELHKNNEIGQLLSHTNQLLTRLEESRRDLRHLATRDVLTDLPNRTLIQEHLISLLASARRESKQVAVIFLDLDRFKTVNDSLGHDVGDKLLQRVALTLVDQLRQQDSVGRLGGDEFLVVLPVTEIDQVISVMNRIIDAMAVPYQFEGHTLRTRASLGVSIYPADGDNADLLMRRADLAMYKAKADPAMKWCLFSEDLSQEVDASMALESALSGALARKELQIFLQPKFNSSGLKLIGCEALLRWENGADWIPPDRFIPIAERSDMILEIGDWVIIKACETLKRWDRAAVPIAVNVSGRQLADADFVERTLGIVKGFGVNPCMLDLEITESILMHDLDQSFERLVRLREAGFKISIDDFGTGYSSLSYLTRLPIDQFKIDRSFVSGSQHSSVVLSTIIAMGQALDIRVVAEGVETEEQRLELAECGCDYLQGFLLGKPTPVSEFEARFGLADCSNIYSIQNQ